MKKTKVIFSKVVLSMFLAMNFLFTACMSNDAFKTSIGVLAGVTGVVDPSLAMKAVDAGIKISEALKVITPSQEYYIGRAVGASILSRYERIDNSAMEVYLNKICMALVVTSDNAAPYNGYHVAIIDSPNLNAFATPGGHILVTTGLIKATESEEQLAAVIAHEISHIQLKHALKAIKSSRATSAIVATSSVAIEASDNETLKNLSEGFGDAVDEVITTMVDSGYSQKTEFEADENAVKLLYLAGYNPYAMNEMLTMLDTKIGTSKGGFGKTHPSAQSRIKKIIKVEDTLADEYSDFAKIELTSDQKRRFAMVQAL